MAAPDPAHRVLGVVITFHPDPASVPVALRAAIAECDGLAVVDNASTPASQGLIADALGPPAGSPKSLTIVTNSANLGVSRAFNQGIALAGPGGFDYVLLLDQDSVIAPGAVAALRQHAAGLSGRFALGALQANNVEPDGRINLDSRRRDYHARRGGYRDATTYQGLLLLNSGSFIPRSVFERIGPFDERYFADFVDYEFSLRLARHGFAVFHVPSVRIVHNVGVAPRPSLVRLYYAIRELTRLLGAYGRQFPGGLAPIVWTTMSRVGSVTLRSRRPWKVIGLVLRAGFDGALGVTGEYSGPRL